MYDPAERAEFWDARSLRFHDFHLAFCVMAFQQVALLIPLPAGFELLTAGMGALLFVCLAFMIWARVDADACSEMARDWRELVVES